MTKRRIVLEIVTSEDGKRCSVECPHVRIDGETVIDEGDAYDVERWRCSAFAGEATETLEYDAAFGRDYTTAGWARHAACLAASEAAVEAEARAEIRGFKNGGSYSDNYDDERRAALVEMEAKLEEAIEARSKS
jgi:hypothetical protein